MSQSVKLPLPTPIINDSLEIDCGIFPDEVYDVIMTQSGDYMKHGPEWSPDCLFVIWSLRVTPRGYEGPVSTYENNLEKPANVPSKFEGLYLYALQTKQIRILYKPKKANESVSFVRWVDARTIEYYKEGNLTTMFVDD